MEYGLCIYGNNPTQNRALRIAFKAKISTNSEYLKLFLSTTTIAERSDRIRIKFWSKLIRAHLATLPNDTFDRWIDYNNKICILNLPKQEAQIWHQDLYLTKRKR